MSVLVEARSDITLITIDRPDRRNAVDRATAVALKEAWHESARERSDEILRVNRIGLWRIIRQPPGNVH